MGARKDKTRPETTITSGPSGTTEATSGGAFVGAFVKDFGAPIYGEFPFQPYALDNFNRITGAQHKLALSWKSFGDSSRNTFDAAGAHAAHARGAVPSVTWEYWCWECADQSNYQLRDITAGQHDALIEEWARDVAAYGKPVHIRWAHEANGTWYPYSPGVNGNATGGEEYKAAFRYIVDKFRAAGATNAKFVWCVNEESWGSTPIEQMYPGDAYVDLVAIDGYNMAAGINPAWRSFTQIFAPTYDKMVNTVAPTKPVYIGEMSSNEYGGDKAAWIRSAYTQEIPNRFPKLKGVVWFHTDKTVEEGIDWRVNTSQASLDAYREAIAADYYRAGIP